MTVVPLLYVTSPTLASKPGSAIDDAMVTVSLRLPAVPLYVPFQGFANLNTSPITPPGPMSISAFTTALFLKKTSLLFTVLVVKVGCPATPSTTASFFLPTE